MQPLRYLSVELPPGPIGVIIGLDSSGNCIVKEKTNPASPLEVNDTLVSLNGTKISSGQSQDKTLESCKALMHKATNEKRRLLLTRIIEANSTAIFHSRKNGSNSNRGTDHVAKKAKKSASTITKSTSSSSSSSSKSTTAKKNKVCNKPKAKAAKGPKATSKPKLKHSSINISRGNTAAAAIKSKSKAKPSKAIAKTGRGGGRKLKLNEKPIQLPEVPLEGRPKPGYLCPNNAYYTCKNDDTYKIIADNVGLDDWKKLSLVEFNLDHYGLLTAKARFEKGTTIRIPTHLCSKWKMDKMVDLEQQELETLAVCKKCLHTEKKCEENVNPMLMCDGCDLEMHMKCAGLDKVPKGDWLCEHCVEVLQARKEFADMSGERSLKAALQPLPELDYNTMVMANKAKLQFQRIVSARKERALRYLKVNQGVIAVSHQEHMENLNKKILQLFMEVKAERVLYYEGPYKRILDRHDIVRWNDPLTRITYKKRLANDDVEIATVNAPMYWQYGPSEPWDEVFGNLKRVWRELRVAQRTLVSCKEKLKAAETDYAAAEQEEKRRPRNDEEEKRNLQLEYATLLGEERLDFETKKRYHDRCNDKPMFLGVVNVELADIQALNMLQEPTELVIAIPTEGEDLITNAGTVEGIVAEKEYYLFGTAELFSPDRDDSLGIDFSHISSMRNAQRQLISILLRDERNRAMRVSQPKLPTSLNLRGTNQEDMSQVSKCFDLSELVRDCNYPIQNQPMAPTPKQLADNGLVLRNYQQASLQFLMDKESNPTTLGLAGELWCRMRSLESSAEDYFFCHVTGSLKRDIFDYASDVEQKDVAKPCGGLPTGAILGEEMGLGKTIICLSLVVASPPPKHNRILPREYLAEINHPLYIPPPSVVGCTSTHSKKVFLSNATLVIAPMTLCSQWQSEIERFAPWMSFLTLHNSENPSIEDIASKDIIVMSTFALSGKAQTLMNKLKRIHFHRIFLDESHYNNSGEKIKFSLASLSATNRYCVTGTPIGHSLLDLYGQLRFLRVPQFCRPRFWKQCVDTPYSEHNYDALQVLRSLLSRIVIRHSKEQTTSNGETLLSLPPRTVETLLLPFGSDAEKEVYQYIENRNTNRFMELRTQSPQTALGQFIVLNGMMYSARQACAHSSIVNLDNMQNLAEKYQRERDRKLGYSNEDVDFANRENKLTTRAGVRAEAISKARNSAKGRMHEAVLQFHEGQITSIECPICFEVIGEKEVALTPCAHKFCSSCIVNILQSASSTREATGSCPECRENIKRSEITFLGHAKEAGEAINKHKETDNDDDDRKPAATEAGTKDTTSIEINGFKLLAKETLISTTGASDSRAVCEHLCEEDKRSQRAFCHHLSSKFLASWNEASTTVGTKIAQLLEEIKMMMQKDPTSKCVVFSQFLGTLDVASQELAAKGVPYVRVDGHMKQHQRADAIFSFTTDPNTRVLLLSMRAGAAGLNLMAANHCFLMDATMNTAIEEQAIDRIHRIGQTRPVVVKRFIMKDTVEERILSIRRTLAADQLGASTQLDGTGMMAEEERQLCQNRKKKRSRQDDENELESQSFDRLQKLEALFGCCPN